MKKIYVCPTYSCNLSCPHCDIKNNSIKTDIDKVIESTKQFKDAFLMLFGGEPFTLSENVIMRLVDELPICSISTNLLSMPLSFIDVLKQKKIDIATSWNYRRFTDQQYRQWLEVVAKLNENGVSTTVLVTLTEDLVQSNMDNVLVDLDKISSESFKGIKFEPYVQSTEDLVDKADEWLSNLYDSWHYSYSNILAEDYKQYGNLHFCDCVYTVQPDGKVVHSCPQMIQNNFLSNCLKCKYNRICRPCVKQKVCTFYKNFYKKVNNYGNDSR